VRRAVFLDRDGVLLPAQVRGGIPRSIVDEQDFELLPGVDEACRALRGAGFFLVVVTNQPDVARGTVSMETVERINAKLRSALPLDDVRVCPHDDADGCDCRKPKPGLLLDAAAEWRLDLADSFMIGDRWRDVEAGRRAGCRVVFIDRGYEETPALDANAVMTGLPEAAVWILRPEERA
jgi:D-glycero-D-manno-heptose 1,7-bisphosphate phosphatase